MALAFALNASAQGLFGDLFGDLFGLEDRREKTDSKKQEPVAFAYDLDFQYRFDNREFAKSDDKITPSMTTNAVVFSPYAGIDWRPSRYVSNRIMIGGNITHHMGTPTAFKDNAYDLMLFYNCRAKLAGGRFEADFGAFPRRFIGGDYSEAFFSDSLKFYDPIVEGMLFKYGNPRFKAEIGLDWMGMKGYDVKERFQIYTAGKWTATSWLALGWAASMYHYAGSVLAPGVVDNHMINPYLKFDLSGQTGLQKLSLKAGLLATYQKDRKFDSTVHDPFGGEFVLNVQHWNVGLRATAYLGDNLLYYYNDHDAAGNKYGNMLYRGSPFYGGDYFLGEIYWSPFVTDYLNVMVNLRFHANDYGYCGCQQVLSLRWNLDATRNAKKHRTILFGDLYEM